MSKRAEEAALKAYPYSPTEVNLFGHETTITADGNSCDRAKYRRGYEQAEKDIIPAAKNLVDAVERYVRQECLRSELLNVKNEVKRILK